MLLLAPDSDPVVNALAARLSALQAPFFRVSPDQLVFAPFWVNEISETGASYTRIQLPDGREIDSRKIHAAYNRIQRLEAIHFLNQVDRQYADMEFTALFFSFMECLSDAMIYPFNLWQMQADQVSEWNLKSAAMAAGLRVTDMELSSAPKWKRLSGMMPFSTERSNPNGFYHKAEHLIWENKPLRQLPEFARLFRVFVAGNQVFSDVTLPFHGGLLKLAVQMGSPYLELKIAELKNGNFAVHEFSIRPDHVHEEAIDALAQALLQKNLQPA